MTTVDLREFQRDVEGYLQRAAAGDALVVTKAEKPLVQIGPAPAVAAVRRPGLAAGKFTVPDDFNDPLPEDVLRDFEGG
jgi:antitoxin (DNA-binding transcriptional repressor) of toxin-antitoxin stability system